MKQNICTIAAFALFLAAAGVIETHFDWAIALIAAVGIATVVGKLDKRRLTARDIERRYGRK